MELDTLPLSQTSARRYSYFLVISRNFSLFLLIPISTFVIVSTPRDRLDNPDANWRPLSSTLLAAFVATRAAGDLIFLVDSCPVLSGLHDPVISASYRS